MKTIVALYDDVIVAQQVVEDLRQAGVERDNISLVVLNLAGDVDSDFEAVEQEPAGETADAAVQGALAGTVVGSLSGVIAGQLIAMAVPGVGPILAAGPLLAGLVGGGIGAVSGGLLGALVAAGVPEEDAQRYAEGVRQGGTLVTAKVMDNQMEMAAALMEQYSPVDIDERALAWQEADERSESAVTDEDVDEFQTYRPTFRRHYETQYVTSGYPFNRYEPAYRYGFDLAHDPRYGHADWEMIETAARRDWDERDLGLWTEFKDAVRHGWEEVKLALNA